MEEKRKLGSSDLFMLFAVLFWALNFSFIKIALREFSPLAFNGIRLLFASLVLLLVLFLSGEGFSLTGSDLLKLILLGIIGNTVFQMFFIHGMNLTTASNTSIIMAMTPVFVALLSSLTKQERIHWLTWLGIGISFVGFYFVITRQPGGISLSGKGIRGDLMIFLGNMCWAIYTVFSKPILERMSPLKLTTITMVMGTVFYVPFCLKDVLHLRLTAISTPAWGALFYSGLFALAICYVIWYFSVKIVGNIKTAIYGYLIPVFTVLFAYIFISETITYWQAVGALIILVGVYLARSR